MRSIDAMHLEHPWAGARTLRDWLVRDGYVVGRKHVAALMRRMGIAALYCKPNTSRRNPAHKIYPYLPRNLAITAPNQVWAMDITYIPMARGFVYLAAVMHWATRRVLAWRLSNSMATGFCIEALEEAIEKFGNPAICNTDQGSQFTSEAFTGLLKEHAIKISMDGKGAWRDNVLIQRLWRSVKYEEVYLRAYDSVSHARASLARYFAFYNARRTHSSLERHTPDEVYFRPAANAQGCVTQPQRIHLSERVELFKRMGPALTSPKRGNP